MKFDFVWKPDSNMMVVTGRSKLLGFEANAAPSFHHFVDGFWRVKISSQCELGYPLSDEAIKRWLPTVIAVFC